MYDVAIIGAGIAGMATAVRCQAAGLSTIVLEAHGQPGGCAGYFRRKGFAFDVGATTLVDFEPGGIGGELLDAIGMAPIRGEQLPGYVVWLPDRTVTLHRQRRQWRLERTQMLGDTPAHRRFWSLLDRLADVFWRASRRGVKLPLRSAADFKRAVQSIGLTNLPLVRYLNWTMGATLERHGLRDERPLVGLLSMLVEDTVHSTLDEAPLINAALGVTIRGAGLTRARGGMYGFWQAFRVYYASLGGRLRVGRPVNRITGIVGDFAIETRRGTIAARQVVSALPVELTARLAPPAIVRKLQPFLRRDTGARGGAVVVFLGVPEAEVAGQDFTHHQVLQNYDAALGNGNNMFISVSAAGDVESAPPGCRAVMISTHCGLEPWQNLPADEYGRRKRQVAEKLVQLARRVYPSLAANPIVYEIGTPITYERFTHRPQGAVGGVRQTLANANQRAVPHDVGVPAFWLAGDTTWPGLGTVACVLGSRLVAEGVVRFARRKKRVVNRVQAPESVPHDLASTPGA